MHHYGLERCLRAAVVVVLAILGPFMASLATDAVFYGTGLGLFVFMVAFGFHLIARWAAAHDRTGSA